MGHVRCAVGAAWRLGQHPQLGRWPPAGQATLALLAAWPQDVTPTRADFYLALVLRDPSPQPSRGASPDGAAGAAPGSALRDGLRQRPQRRSLSGLGRSASKRLESEGCEVEVVFPCLRPRLSLLRQVRQACNIFRMQGKCPLHSHHRQCSSPYTLWTPVCMLPLPPATQVYQQLQPLLQNDLDSLQDGPEAAGAEQQQQQPQQPQQVDGNEARPGGRQAAAAAPR